MVLRNWTEVRLSYRLGYMVFWGTDVYIRLCCKLLLLALLFIV
jgi:hypothetical protein